MLARCGLSSRDYVYAIAGAKVSLGLLSKGNRDQHTRRSSEIPYAGGLFCAERTDEHQQLYQDGKESMFWNDAALILTANATLSLLCIHISRSEMVEIIAEGNFSLPTKTPYDARKLEALVGKEKLERLSARLSTVTFFVKIRRLL